MANYRRLISYIYAYEGEIKGKNIGFVKLESRNGQCRLSVNVKKVYVGSSDLGVYLMAPGGEICLGTIFIRSGAGEFNTTVSVENVADSGARLEDCYGLTVHEAGDTWRSYATIWEDAVPQTAQVQLAELTVEKRGNAEEQIHRNVAELNEEMGEEQPVGRQMQPEVPTPAPISEPVQPNPPVTEPEPVRPVTEPRLPVEPGPPVTAPMRPATAPQLPPAAPEPSPQEPSVTTPTTARPPEELMPLENRAELNRLEEEEREQSCPQRLWDSFRSRYPKIQDFDSNAGGCEILTISPQAIGLLPRETWNYGNNSFLLHGYYNYRYLILARVGDEEKGKVRYILGVPGHYYSNEKYMASMFGFPYFVLSKKQPSRDGRFGYWYADVKMESGEQ